MIEKPALIIYAFAFESAEDKPAGRYMGQLWEACIKPTGQGGFGMTEPVSGISESFVDSLSAFRPLASACVPASEKDEVPYVAFRFAYNDVFGLIACLSPDQSAATWPALYTQWRCATSNAEPPQGVLSESYVFYARHGSGEKPAQMGQEVVSALPQQEGKTTRADSPAYAMGNGIYLWESEPLNGRRTFAVLGSELRNRRIVAANWLFWSNERELATFAAYLLNSAKLNYEYLIYSRDIRGLREKEKQVDALIDSVLRIHSEIQAGRHINTDELIECQNRVGRVQSDSSGLLIQLSHLRELQQTVRIAEYNLRALIGPARATRANETHAFLKQDLERARWLEKQIDCDITYSETICNRALESYRVTDLRLEQVRQANARRQHHLELTQTVLLGALLICLNAMHAFHTEVPFAHELQWPVIAFLMALAFTIPPLLLNWREGYGKLEYLGATFVGASVASILAEVSRQDLERSGYPRLLRFTLILGLIVSANAALWSLDQLQKRRRRKS